MSAQFWLSRNLKEVIGLPDDAHDWLMGLWNVIQVFDDMADGDFPDRDQLDVAIYDAIAALPANPFFEQNRHVLLPVLALQILKWKASDQVERAHEPNAVSFVWRAGFYDVVLAVVQLVHGTENALLISGAVLKLYGESLDDYLKEFSDA